MKPLIAISTCSLETVNGGATQTPVVTSPAIEKGLAFLGSGYKSGILHQQGIKEVPYSLAHDPTPYRLVYANDGAHTAAVLVNPANGSVRRQF